MFAAEAIDRARADGGSALVVYLPVGYPDLETSKRAVLACVEAGADIIELGVPYSDPGMDGPVIQAAGTHALKNGFRVRDIFGVVEAVAEAGAACEVMTYYNPVLRYGVDRFAADLASAGGAGLIIPDLIPEEADEWMGASDTHGLDRIFVIAPSSRTERLEQAASASRGFVYAASTMGVTGTRSNVDHRAEELVARTREAGAERVCVGLGVSNGDQAAEIARFADGVIVGSAAVRAVSDDLTELSRLVTDLARGAHGQ